MRAVTATGTRAARNAVWRFGATAIDAVRAAVTVPLIARELGVVDYSAWSVVATLLAFLHPIAIGGTTGTLVREIARAPDRGPAILAAGRTLRLLLALASVPVVGVLALLLVGADGGLAALVLAAGLVLEALATPALLLSARLREDLVSLARAVGSLAAIAGVVVAVALSGGLLGIAVATLAGVATTASLGLAFASRATPSPRVPAAPSEIAAIARLAWPIALSSLLAAALLQGDVALVEALAGPVEAGVLGASGRVVAVGIAVPVAISAALAPILATRSGTNALALVRSATRVSAAVGLVLAAMMVLGAPAIAALLGPGFGAVRELLPVLAVRVALSAAGAPWAALLLALRGQREILAIQGGVFAAVLVASFVIVPAAGALGAAWIAVGGEACAVALQVRAARRRA